MTDPYKILGVARTATTDDVRKVYRRLAKTLHPDLNPGDKAAEARFKEVAGAYDLLSDPTKRQRFDNGEIDASGAERPTQRYYKDFASAADGDDRYRSRAGFADFADTNDIFAELLRRQAERARFVRGEDLHYRLAIDFLDAINGATRRLTMPNGASLDVAIPPGSQDGHILRLRGKGAPSPGEGPPGDALIELTVNPHPLFERRGDDIYVELPISLSEAVLGARIKAPTPSGPVMLTVPKGSNTGAVLRLKGKGAPRAGGNGDEFVKLKVVLPTAPNAELEAFAASWAPGPDYDPRKDMGL
ncbi:MAG: J domain-containing protein [Terricaulis sp.]